MLKIGSLKLETPLLLAPIAGFCDLAFRKVARSIRSDFGGIGLACTDLLCPQAILNQSDKTLWLAATSEDDSPLCMQLYGRHPDVLCEAALWAQAHGADIIDLNMGCPVDKVTKKNGGSKLLCEPNLATEIITKLCKTVQVPITAKIRLGPDNDHWITQTLPIQLADAGVSAITVHGRTTAQKFSGTVQLKGISQVVESVKRSHPQTTIIGNGDIKTPMDAKIMMQQTGCDGVMIGRGALGQPWIFRDAAHYLATGQLPSPYPQIDRIKAVLLHFETLLSYRGPRVAVNTMRQRMSRYSAYLQPWPGLKKDIQAIHSPHNFRDYFEKTIDHLTGKQAL